jgi:hypothetical protein
MADARSDVQRLSPGSKRTQADRKSAGSGVWMIGSCHTVPVKLGAGMRRDGRDPQAIMSMVIPSPYCIRINSSFCGGLV